MPEPDPKIAMAASRSNDDAKAVNSLFQAAGQAAILINGGAATALLALSGASSSLLKPSPSAIASALGFLALGVISGALLIMFQAVSVQKFLVLWEGEVMGYGKSEYDRNLREGNVWGRRARIAFAGSILCFFFGVSSLAFSLSGLSINIGFTSQPINQPQSLDPSRPTKPPPHTR